MSEIYMLGLNYRMLFFFKMKYNVISSIISVLPLIIDKYVISKYCVR